MKNSNDACFPSGIGTPNSPPQSDPTGPPQSNPTPVSSPIMSPTDSCPSGESSMTIKIQTDEHVNKDKSKLKVKQRVKKATGGFRWKNVKGMSASLRKLKNKNVTRRKCLLKSKCYRIQVIEKKNAVNMGMEGPITVIFKGKHSHFDHSLSNFFHLLTIFNIGDAYNFPLCNSHC